MEIKIQEVKHNNEIYCRYSGQIKPQDTYIGLDTRNGKMWAECNCEIGNAIPFNVWHGQVRRYTIPLFNATSVNELMEEIKPLAQRLVDGASEEWDGNNMVTRLTEDAQEAEEEICKAVDSFAGEYIQVYDVYDWFEYSTDEYLGIKPGMSDEEISALCTKLEKDIEDDSYIDILDGDIEKYLRYRLEKIEITEDA